MKECYKEYIYYIQLCLSIFLSLFIHNRYDNILVTMINIDSIHNLFVYVLKNIYIYGRQCPRILLQIGDRIKTFNQNIRLYEYNKEIHIRYSYYLLLYVTNINLNYFLYDYGKRTINLITISLTIPYVSKYYVYPYSYDVYKKIDELCYILICKIIAALLNLIAKTVFKIEPRIDHDEIKPYVLSNQKNKYFKKFIGSFVFSTILIYIENIGYIYSTKVVKNIYQKKLIRKNKQESIERIFITRRWDKLINPIVLNDFYFVYNKLNDIDYPIEKQVQEAINFIIKKFLEIYYLHYLSKFINLSYSMPFILFFFYKFNHVIFGITSIVSVYNNTLGLLVFESIYYINDNMINIVKKDTMNYIEKNGFLYVDLSVYYISVCILISYFFSFNNFMMLMIFLFMNYFYEETHKDFYIKIYPCSNISYKKHKIMTGNVIIFGYLSSYNLFHMLFIPFIFNVYSYFLWSKARYKKQKEKIKYVIKYF